MLTGCPVPACVTGGITIDKTDENFRLLYNTKGRFVLHLLKHKQEAEVGPLPCSSSLPCLE